MLSRLLCVCYVVCVLNAPTSVAQGTAVRWWEPYSGVEAIGPDVVGLWKFDGDEASFAADSSSHKHKATLRGARQSPDGRFGACLESAAGYPVADESHGLHISRSPVLSLGGPFTVEMWIRAKDADDFPETYSPVLLDMKYVPGNHTGFMFTMTRGSSTGTRQLGLEIGTGAESSHWYSLPFKWEAGIWRHVAFTYDARGTVEFFVDGAANGRTTKSTAGPMAAAVRPLSIGDRIGSLYRGFPGFIDEVRITKGVREFRPVSFVPDSERFVFLRMSKDASLTAQLINRTGEPLSGVKVTARLPDGSTQQITVPDLGKGESHPVEVKVDAALKPGEYFVDLSATLPKWGGSDAGYQSVSRIPVVIVEEGAARPNAGCHVGTGRDGWCRQGNSATEEDWVYALSRAAMQLSAGLG